LHLFFGTKVEKKNARFAKKGVESTRCVEEKKKGVCSLSSPHPHTQRKKKGNLPASMRAATQAQTTAVSCGLRGGKKGAAQRRERRRPPRRAGPVEKKQRRLGCKKVQRAAVSGVRGARRSAGVRAVCVPSCDGRPRLSVSPSRERADAVECSGCGEQGLGHGTKELGHGMTLGRRHTFQRKHTHTRARLRLASSAQRP
jgi:hypothetical protein